MQLVNALILDMHWLSDYPARPKQSLWLVGLKKTVLGPRKGKKVPFLRLAVKTLIFSPRAEKNPKKTGKQRGLKNMNDEHNELPLYSSEKRCLDCGFHAICFSWAIRSPHSPRIRMK